MNTEDVLLELEIQISNSTQNLVAKEMGVSAQYLSDIRRRRRAIGPKVLAALGIKRSIEFVPLRPKRKARP
jgi:transcriptional regulator with XRE-family HTH domain